MYKQYELIPKNLILELEFTNRVEKIEFEEPTLYILEKANKLFEQKEYYKGISLICKIKEKDFLSNPNGIINGILELIYGKKEGEPIFVPALYDIVCKRYGILPIDLIKKTTPSMLEGILAGIEYNINIENDKEKDNKKFRVKTKIEQEKIDKALEKINNLHFKD